MAKRIAFQGDTGETYEVIPSDGAYPGDAITIPELTAKVSGPQGWFEKTDVSDSFSADGICDVYRDGTLLKTGFIYDSAPLLTSMDRAKKSINFENGRIIVTDRIFLGDSAVLPDAYALKKDGITHSLIEFGTLTGIYKLADASPAITDNGTYELYYNGAVYQISGETVMVEVVDPDTFLGGY